MRILTISLIAALCLIVLPLQASAKSTTFEPSDIKEKEREAPAIPPEMVRIPGKNYEIGKYEVTQKEWRDIMGSSPSYFSNCGDNCPVEQVSWNDVQEFLQKLNAKTDKQYRLPTEAEWVYACSEGKKISRCNAPTDTLDITDIAWFELNSKQTTHPCGQKKVYGLGLYDMIGNVWEWMNDSSDGVAALRGGSWFNLFLEADPIDRNRTFLAPLSRRSSLIGFRLARTLSQ